MNEKQSLIPFLFDCLRRAASIIRGNEIMDREEMVRTQIEARGVTDPRVLEAVRNVDREQFVMAEDRERAHADHPLAIGEQQTISQPYIVALMTELLDPKPGDRILEIGAGSGYQAAVLAEIAGEVYTVEIIESLGLRAEALLRRLGYDNVHVRIGDGYQGWPEEAPFDGVIVTAAPPEVPPPLAEQLKPGGRMVIPVGQHLDQTLKVIEKQPDGSVRTQRSIGVRFVPMTGRAQRKEE